MGWLSNLFGTDDAKDTAILASGTMANAFGDASDVRSVGLQDGANMAIDGMQNAENFIRDRGSLPMNLRDNALRGLGEYYQGPNSMADTQGMKTQAELIAEARNSPMYGAIMNTRMGGEDAILRNASATGGLRSGGSNRDLLEYNQDLEGRALMTGYGDAVARDKQRLSRQDDERIRQLQGMNDLANMDDYTGEIAGLIQGREGLRGRALQGAAEIRGDAMINATGAMTDGWTAAEGIRQQGRQNIINTGIGAISGFADIGGIPGIAALFSDIRLKEDIRPLGAINGVNIYGWTWNDKAKELGLKGECSGVLAHEVFETSPKAISEKDGYIQVDYSKIDFAGA